MGLNKNWLKAQELVSVKAQWVKFHYPKANEPPYSDRLHGGVERAEEKPALARL